MSKVIIPVSIQLGNSLQQIKQVNKGFEELASTASKPLQTVASDQPVKSIRRQLREANIELQNIVAQFGRLSPEAQAAAVRVAELKDVIEDSNRAAAAGDLDDSFQVAGRAVAGVAGAFQSVLAIQGLFGEQSKATEEALKKVQAAMALTQGITSIFEGVKAFKALYAQIINSNAVLRIYAASTVVAGAVTRAFGGAVNTASFAFKGLAVAIAATGIGLIITALGFAIPLLIKFFTSTKNADNAVRNLTNAEENLANEIQRTNRQLEERESLLEFETKLAVLNAEAAGKSQEDIQKIEQEARTQRIKDAKAALEKATQDYKDNTARAFNDLYVVRQQGNDEEIKQATETYNKIKKEQKDFFFERKKALTDAERDDVLSVAQIAADTRKKQDQDAKQELEKRKQESKRRSEDLKRAQEEANKILLELSRRGATESQEAIFNIQDQYNEKRKKLAEAGIKDFTQLNKAEAEDISKVQNESNNAVLKARQDFENALAKIFLDGVKKRKELQDQADEAIKNSRELAQRAELSGIKDDRQKKLQELRNAENKEMEELEKAYEEKKISLEKFLQDQANIEAFYSNQRASVKTKEQEDEIKRIEDFQATVTDALASAADALGSALIEGADPFQAVFKSLANSLGGYLQQLGKDAIKTSALISKLRVLIGTPQGIVTGIALVALGAAIKAAFNKKSEKGFARGGFIYGPGTETSDSIPARLSKGEYVIQAKSVRKYGARTMDKINSGQVPVASLLLASERGTGRNGQSAKALVNRSGEIQLFNRGGLAESFRQFGRNGGSAKALVNRFEIPDFNSTAPVIGGESFQRGEPYIVTTKISGQDLKLVLERADRRFSNAT